MFERRRKGGRNWLYVAVGGTLASVRAATAEPVSPSPNVTTSGPDAGGLAVVFGVFAGMPAAVGIGKLVRFSEARQTELENAYRSGKALPKSMAGRLNAKDF
ncbi:hypothetical protein Q3A66_02020 [Hymenobacter sp. BT770]|uniref:hypothetical protein n=1 Tax=Hymenobacter sp. BT770 TaxID=2886942 RepID=UPI001D0F5ABE|nr:hypothetical protein [Hymenobacter sp. BT770]MDO3413828.1 hypothetical protein [Hymenobacter sp. BT770]